jgi:N-acetylglucosamine kinase-like BadF-type ATPase
MIETSNISEGFPKLVLAIDGGGSKTLCWVAAPPDDMVDAYTDWKVLGRGSSGPSNPRSVGFDQAFNNLELAINQACEQAFRSILSSKSPSIDVACLSMAGVGRPEEQQRVHAWAVQQQLARQIVVVDDIEPLRWAAQHEDRLRSAISSPSGQNRWSRSITLVVGTGAIASGVNDKGGTARSDGWGYLLGDHGSGYAMGLAGLRSICEAHDQGLELSAFHRALLDELELENPKQLIAWIYRENVPRPSIAQLSRIILSFMSHDPVAEAIVEDAIESMVTSISNVARRLSISDSDYALALSGGILRNNSRLVERLSQKLSIKKLAPHVVHIVNEPINGALALASQMI